MKVNIGKYFSFQQWNAIEDKLSATARDIELKPLLAHQCTNKHHAYINTKYKLIKPTNQTIERSHCRRPFKLKHVVFDSLNESPVITGLSFLK